MTKITSSEIARPAESGGLPLLTLAAKVRPRYRFEARLRDRLLTGNAYAIRTLSHASERLFNRFQETPLALVQVDLKLRFRIGIGLVNKIALRAACRWHPGEIIALARQQFTLLLQ